MELLTFRASQEFLIPVMQDCSVLGPAVSTPGIASGNGIFESLDHVPIFPGTHLLGNDIQGQFHQCTTSF